MQHRAKLLPVNCRRALGERWGCFALGERWGCFSAHAQMHAAFRLLSQRVFEEIGRRFHEPPHQNGYDCLLLAALDQMDDQGFTLSVHAAELRMAVKSFLREWKTLVLDHNWEGRAAGAQCAELTLLCDAGPDYLQFLTDPKAVGTQAVLLAICGVLSVWSHVRVEAQVHASRQRK